MESRIDDVLKTALEMPAEDRAVLAEQLLLSLDPKGETDVEVAWQEEVARRLREVEGGNVQTVPWESIRARLRGQRATG